MARAVTIPLKYKFLGVMLFVLLSALSVFLYLAQQTFSEDKKLFIMDSNRTLLKAATSEIKLELKSRLEELQSFVPRVYMGGDKIDPFQGLSPTFAEELIGVTFFRQKEDGEMSVLKQFSNQTFLTKQKLSPDFLAQIDKVHPITNTRIDKTQGVDMVNRSVSLAGADVPVLSFILGANFLGDAAKELFIVVDFSQTFLMRTLAQSELTEVFLLFGNGTVLSH
ncbi:hypothetical protein K2X33_13855, partial [bacterium]|nr:hypothetical protein [bacterium]